MSWDIFIMRVDADVATIDDLPPEYLPPPLGPASTVRDAIATAFPGTRWDDPTCGSYDSGDLSLEFAIGKNAIVETLMVLVRSGGDPVSPLASFCHANQWRALDVQSGEFIPHANPNSDSWVVFCEWRDRILGS